MKLSLLALSSSFLLLVACSGGSSSTGSDPSSEPSDPAPSATAPAEANGAKAQEPASPAAPAAPAKAATVPCAYHDFDADKDVTSCDAATQFCLRSYGQTEGPGSTNVCAPLPTACSGCGCATDAAPDAWKKAENNTNNCTKSGVTLACSAHNGAITVDCVLPY